MDRGIVLLAQVKEIGDSFSYQGERFRWTAESLLALQEVPTLAPVASCVAVWWRALCMVALTVCCWVPVLGCAAVFTRVTLQGRIVNLW